MDFTANLIIIGFLCWVLPPVVMLLYAISLSNRIQTLKIQIDKITQHIFLEQKTECKPDPEAEMKETELIEAKNTPPQAEFKEEPIIQQIEHTQNKHETNQNLEKAFGTKMTAWIGGIALIFSGFYLVKYSIEHSVLTPLVRVIIGSIFALCALGAAHYIHLKPNFSNGNTISQSLSGAGIATLYGCFYAAGNLYNLLSNTHTFIGMAIVTAIAVLSSLRHGPYVAVLGLIGGFVTPFFVGSTEPSAPLFFGYLYLLFSGLMIVSRQKGWWKLSLLNVTGALLWSVIWCLKYPHDLVWINIFLSLVFMTISAITHSVVTPLTSQTLSSITPVQLLSYGGMAACLLVIASFSATIQFTFQDWGLFYLLALATLVLTYIKPALYSYVTYMLIPISALMLYIWNEKSLSSFLIVFTAFALSYILGGVFMLLKNKKPSVGAIITALARVAYFVCLFLSFDKRSQSNAFIDELPALGIKLLHSTVEIGIPFFWDILFIPLCLPMAYYVYHLIKKNPELTAEHKTICASFLTGVMLLCMIYIHYRFKNYNLSYLYPILAIALTYLGRFFEPRVLRYPLIPLCLYAIVQAVLSVLDCESALSQNVLALKNISKVFANVPMHHILAKGATCILFGFAAKKLYDLKLQRFSILFTCAFIAGAVASMHNAIGIMTYDFSREAHHLVYCFLLLSYIGLSLLFYKVRTYIKNDVLYFSAYVLSFISIIVLVKDHLFFHPWNIAPVFGYCGWNTLLLFYALPALGIFLIAQQWKQNNHKQCSKMLSGFAFFLSIVWVSLNIRYYFHNPYLLKGMTTNTELYTYSALWLTIGLVLVALGIKMKNQLLRVASLAILLITIGKVFLFDASHLDGLYRVASFFGLGISLLALSYFYSKFVFTKAAHSLATNE